MKKSIFTLTIYLLSIGILCGQTTIKKMVVRDHQTNSNWQVFTVDQLKPMLFDGTYEKAISQHDIIGNDYTAFEKILGKNSNADGSATPTNFIPVNDYKMTFCGSLRSYDFHDPFPVVGQDNDLEIVLTVDPANPNLTLNKYLWNSDFSSAWNIMEGEVNIHDAYRDRYPNPANVLESDVCMYGAWVIEQYDVTECCFTHANNNEIHPVDQFWYKDHAVGKNNTSYSLNFFVDNSGRFDDREDYYSIPSGGEFKPWSKTPMDGIFAVAFEINLKRKDRITYWIEPTSDLGVEPAKDDGKVHYLIYGKDTLVKVYEGAATTKELVNIDFGNIGFIRSNNKNVLYDSSVIRGFLLIKSTIAGPIGVKQSGETYHSNEGNLRLRVEKQTVSDLQENLLITIQKIKRLQDNSYRFLNSFNQRLYTDPVPIPPHFNEEQVYLTLSAAGQDKSQLIPELVKGQSSDLQNITGTWRGTLSDQYLFNLVCTNGYGGQVLGSIKITGSPSPIINGVTQTVLGYQLPDNSSIQNVVPGQPQPPHLQIKANLFEITYKIDIIPQQANPIRTP